MYDRQISIPAKGERTTVSDVAGVALQTTRLEFLGSEDPKGNPVIEADGGRLSARMVVGDPIRKEFSGLVVRNPDSSEAAGTVAIVRIYEEGDVISRVPRKRQLTARAPVDFRQTQDIASDQFSITSSRKFQIVPENSYHSRVQAVSILVNDLSLSSGGHVIMQLSFDDQDIIGEKKAVGVGQATLWTLGKNLIVPENQTLDVKYIGRSGSGDIDFTAEYSYIWDAKSPIPPR